MSGITGVDGGRMTGIGLAIAASSADDHFVAALVHALAAPLIAEGVGLFTRVVDDAESEKAMYRHWAASEGIAGVVLLGGGRGDARIDLLRSIGLPFASVVDQEDAGDDPAVLIDVTASVAVLSRFLEGRRHDRTVYIVGPTDTVTSRERANAVAEKFELVRTPRDPAAAVAAATAVLESGPATLVFDSDVHAVAAEAALLERGIRIPADVAIVSWTDSAVCRSASPSITAVDRRGSEIGALLGARILRTIAGDAPGWDRAPDPFIVRRESS